jgi:hypothetical protein
MLGSNFWWIVTVSQRYNRYVDKTKIKYVVNVINSYNGVPRKILDGVVILSLCTTLPFKVLFSVIGTHLDQQ